MNQFYYSFLDWLTLVNYLSENKEKILKVCFRLSNDSHAMYFRPVLVNNMQLFPLKSDHFFLLKLFMIEKKRFIRKTNSQLFQKSYGLRR